MLTSLMIWAVIALGYVYIVLKWGEPFYYFLQLEIIGFIENRRLTRKSKKEPQTVQAFGGLADKSCLKGILRSVDKHPQEGDGIGAPNNKEAVGIGEPDPRSLQLTKCPHCGCAPNNSALCPYCGEPKEDAKLHKPSLLSPRKSRKED